MKQLIINSINSHQGIKTVQLVMNIMSHIGPSSFNPYEFNNSLNELVRDKEVIEIIYYIPNDVRRSIYFPKGTKFI